MERKQRKEEGGRRMLLSFLRDPAEVFILHFIVGSGAEKSRGVLKSPS